MPIRGLNKNKAWDYENGFYWYSPYTRLAKQIAHWEIYKRILSIPGDVVELGVYKGASLIRWATFREISENSFSRNIVGFDAFGEFPLSSTASKDDIEFVEGFSNAGGDGLSLIELTEIIEHKKFQNIALNKGDIFKTIPDYLSAHPHLKISLLHLDMDIYEPTIFALENLWDRVSNGGIVVIDDYNAVSGATRAVDEFISNRGIASKIEKSPFYTIPSFIVKQNL